jgi:hypothetical protein
MTDRGRKGDWEQFEDRADYQRASETVRGQLRDRGIVLYDDEDGETLIEMLEAVQQFEAAVAEQGGDSMANAIDSRHPENPEFVLPQRLADETPAMYVRRITRAARGVRRRR